MSLMYMSGEAYTNRFQPTECGYDDYLGALSNELSECLRECKVPTYEHSDWTNGSVYYRMRIVSTRSQMGALWMPLITLVIEHSAH